MAIIPVVLCGGSGTRLWPLNRKSLPKQFVPLIGGDSLLSLTLKRVGGLAGQAPVICVAADEHRFLVQQSAREQGLDAQLLLEPVARNTAPAIGLAALLRQATGAADDVLLVCPADHHIPDTARFHETIRRGIPLAEQGAVVTFGVVPSFPSTAYGYIRHDPTALGCAHAVQQFIEKPAAEAAQRLLLEGNVLWNAGIFLMRVDTMIKALRDHAGDILEVCEAAMQKAEHDGAFVRPAAATFGECRSQSIDYAVMEPLSQVVLPRDESPRLAVVPFAGAWSDVGSWNAVADLAPADDAGNRIEGQGHVLKSRNTFIHASGRPVVALGTEDLLIIDTADAVLVAQRSEAEAVKEVVAMLERRGCEQALSHRKVARPWGCFDSVDEGHRFKVKRITVNPGASLSLQKHHHRAEHWIVVKGTAEVTCGDRTFLLTENQSTYIPIGEVHRLANPGRVELEMIEVQSGAYLGEDDIVRFEDQYGRG